MATSINTLTPSDVAIAIKQHRSMNDLCLKYQCTQDDIILRLNRIYTNETYPSKIISILRNNDKQRQRDLNRRSKNRRKSSRSAIPATIAPPQ